MNSSKITKTNFRPTNGEIQPVFAQQHNALYDDVETIETSVTATESDIDTLEALVDQDVTDGSSPTFGSIKTDDNVGTANTGVTAVEYGDGFNHTTVLTIDQDDAITLADNASLADGYLLYTLPAGACIINSAYMSLDFDNTEHDAEAADIGLGTVIASGAVAVLGGTATFENIITGQTGAVGTAEVKTATPTAGVPFVIESGDAHTIHANIAGAWADTAGTDLDADLTGTVVINWTFLA